jgi:hypothetical protein
MHMLADIASGNTGTADVLFLIAAILFGIAALTHFFAPHGGPEAPRAAYWGWTPALVDAGLCLIAIGWLVL